MHVSTRNASAVARRGSGRAARASTPISHRTAGAASATWRMPRPGASPLTVGAATESLPSGGTSGQRTPSCTCRRTMLSRAASGRQSRTRARQSGSRRLGGLEHRRRQQEWQLQATRGRTRHRRGDCDGHCAHDCDRSKAAQEGAGPRARDKIGCSAKGGSGSGSHCAGAMKRRRSTPVSRPLPPRAVAAVRKGPPHSLTARLARVRRQRVTSATVPRVAAGEPLSRDYLQLTTTCWVVRTPFTFCRPPTDGVCGTSFVEKLMLSLQLSSPRVEQSTACKQHEARRTHASKAEQDAAGAGAGKHLSPFCLEA